MGDYLSARMAAVLAILAALVLALPVRAQSCPTPRTALVLSGGGAKGLAHIGVIRVLDSLGVRPDLVVGTSMGAIVGALYASGYTGAAIDSIARSLPVGSLFRTYRPRAPRSLGVLHPLVVWEQGEGSFRLQGAAVRDRDVNATISAALLRGNLLAAGDFDSLPIPFRAVATDLADRSVVAIGEGDLAQAVRASFSVPLLFVPVQVDGRYLVDGGLAANIPVAVAREAGAERVIVSDASTAPADSVDLASPLAVADRLVDLLFEQAADSLGPADILVRPRVGDFPALDFSARRVDRIITAGAEAADSALRSVECLPRAARPAVPPVAPTVVDVDIVGATESEARTIRRILALEPGEPVDVAALADRIRRLSRSEVHDALWLNPRVVPGGVSFDIVLQRAPRRVAGGSVVYDADLGGRLWAGLTDRRLLGLGIEGSAAVFLGELRKELALGVRRSYGFTRRLITPVGTVQLGSEDVLRYTEAGKSLSPADVREAIGFVGLDMAPGRGWELAVGLEGRLWEDPDERRHSTAGPAFRAAKIGPAGDRLVFAEAVWAGLYRRAELDAVATIRLHPLRLRPRVRVGYGEDLPIQIAFPLGGTDGFPGLQLGEQRGDREVMLGVTGFVPLAGPFEGTVELATGRSGSGNALFGPQRWMTGARIGIAADTPLGPVRLAYGFASVGRGAVLVRLGRWF